MTIVIRQTRLRYRSMPYPFVPLCTPSGSARSVFENRRALLFYCQKQAHGTARRTAHHSIARTFPERKQPWNPRRPLTPTWPLPSLSPCASSPCAKLLQLSRCSKAARNSQRKTGPGRAVWHHRGTGKPSRCRNRVAQAPFLVLQRFGSAIRPRRDGASRQLRLRRARNSSMGSMRKPCLL